MLRKKVLVEVEWEAKDGRRFTIPRRSTVEIPSFIMEDFHRCGSSRPITDYLRDKYRFRQFEWEWIDEETKCQ